MMILCKNKGVKLITKVCIIVSVFITIYGYNLLSNKSTIVNAMEITNSSAVGLKQISSGKSDHNVFMKNDGTVWGCGRNNYGQLGIGNLTNQSLPVQIPITNVKEIESGYDYTFFIKNDGTVWACGNNEYGELGTGDTVSRSTLVQVPITNVKSIKGGVNHTIFIKNDGTIWTCGLNSGGELGIGNTTNKYTPVQVTITNVKDVCNTQYSTIFLKNDGTVWGCGLNNYAQLGIGNTTKQLSAVQIPITNVKNVDGNYAHTIFLKNDGTVYGCGDNSYMQLGKYFKSQLSPVQISISNVKDIECGDKNTMFVKNDGKVWVCGYDCGQLGMGEYSTVMSLHESTITNVEQFICVNTTSYIIKSDGSIWGSGDNSYGQLGRGDTKNQLTFVNLSKYWSSELIRVMNEVVKAELSKLQVDVDLAQAGINILPVDDTDTIALQNRLDAVKLFIATDAVVKTESDKKQGCVDWALGLVNVLPSSTNKTNLLNRLNVVQNGIDLTSATNAVVKAETSKQQIDVARATSLVDVLTASTDKTNLLNRLTVVQNTIDLSNGAKLVTNAETTKQQIDIYKAKDLVNSLPDSTDKTDLSARLQNVEYDVNSPVYLTEAINAVTVAEESKVQLYVDKAVELVNNLKDSTDKINLIKRLTIVQGTINLANAQSAVSKAESSLLQTDADVAKSLTVALPSSTDRSALLNRLVNVQNIINLANARTAVNIAEGSKQQSDLDAAAKLVNALPSSTSKTDLGNRLVALQNVVNLANATNAVLRAEATKAQVDLDYATSLVVVLSDYTSRISLQSRLANVQNSINLNNAINAVSKAEATNLQDDVDTANSLVIALPTSTSRTNLLNRLAVVQNNINLIEPTKAVSKAEATNMQADVDVAKELVIVLPTSTSRTDLLNRLIIVQNNINLTTATTSVSKAEVTKIQADVDIAKNLVVELPTSTEKSNLLNRLVNVQNIINSIKATNAVVKAEGSKEQADVDSAMNSVNVLQSSTTKTTLLSRLAAVQNSINLTNATNAVIKAEETKAQQDVDSAQTAVNALPQEDTNKVTLQGRIDDVQAYINNVNAITTKVETAENTKIQTDVDAAQTAVNTLLQDDTNKSALQVRTDAVQAYINNVNDATTKVETAENTKTQTDVDSAQTAVNALPQDDTNKSTLQTRIDVVQIYINDVKDVTTKVETAENTKTQNDIDTAQEYINKLPEDDVNKIILQQRLDLVKS